jgi:hypothetical protein
MNLSPREKMVLDLLDQTRTGKELAQKMGTKFPPTAILSRLKQLRMVKRVAMVDNEAIYQATPWQNRPCVLGVRL